MKEKIVITATYL